MYTVTRLQGERRWSVAHVDVTRNNDPTPLLARRGEGGDHAPADQASV